MGAVIQRVAQANVVVDEELLERIGKGFPVLLGVANEDIRQMAGGMADRICRLRTFEDKNGKTNLLLEGVEDELLVVGQFTPYADYRRGDRPSFIKAGAPQMAGFLYKHFMGKCRTHVGVVEKGRFGTDMKMELLNDGPFTLMLDSQELSGEQKTEEPAVGKRRATWYDKGLQTGPVERR